MSDDQTNTEAHLDTAALLTELEKLRLEGERIRAQMDRITNLLRTTSAPQPAHLMGQPHDAKSRQKEGKERSS